ncbi:MAG: glycosyltransferase family 2 protein [Pseudomonadota bacterium]
MAGSFGTPIARIWRVSPLDIHAASPNAMALVTETAPTLTILIPFYDEAGNVLPVLEEVFSVLEGIPFDVVAVDDASEDATPSELAEAMMRWPEQLSVRTHVERAGKSAALMTGLAIARGSWVQLLDGDGQNDPADTRRVWDTLIADRTYDHIPVGAEPMRLGLVAGRRTSRNDSGFKWVQSRIANGIRRFALGDDATDSGCGWKLIRTEAFRQLPYFASMHRFLPALVKRAGWRVIEEPVNDRKRLAGQSKYGFLGRAGAGLIDLFGVMWLVQRGRRGVAREWLESETYAPPSPSSAPSASPSSEEPSGPSSPPSVQSE